MNIQTDIVNFETALAYLSETMFAAQAVPERSAEAAVAALHEHFRSHSHYLGDFSTRTTPAGFVEITFTGEVLPGRDCAKRISHTIMC